PFAPAHRNSPFPSLRSRFQTLTVGLRLFCPDSSTSPSFYFILLLLFHQPPILSAPGLWSLEYKRTLTNPLCISASHGHTACLRHLLFRRADPNAAPGGRSALHEACTGGHTDCAELLLEHKANPNLLDEDGHAPLHLCTSQNTLGCAKALVRFGALVNLPSEESQDTPIHLAAKHGLYEHVHLYLRYGATVDKKNSLEETALSVACGEAKKVEDQERYLQQLPQQTRGAWQDSMALISGKAPAALTVAWEVCWQATVRAASDPCSPSPPPPTSGGSTRTPGAPEMSRGMPVGRG
uniref:Ankyrin repeat and SOCS box containing 18 n=1 Tax=Varanus komodoensis TaxID=61221 RepID=A0A8D2KZZ4_VARKO